jgi:1,4-dihydroxy-2-naphthoate octaprenyltransferase
MKFKAWIKAARPHTLPLAISGILVGNMMAYNDEGFSKLIFILSLFTAILLQILSNFANDYGDSVHGTDNENRVGPKRSIQSGEITKEQMKKGIGITIVLSLFSGLFLLYSSIENVGWLATGIVLAIGLLSIWAAYYYTASKNPYGYKGLGDLFVFIFFGLVAVYGPYYLQSPTFKLIELLPAIAIGLFSTAVLNLNNIRDIDNDRESGKRTIPVRIGKSKALVYQTLLLNLGNIALIVYFIFRLNQILDLIFLAPLLFIIQNNIKTYQVKKEISYYPLLMHLSISVFLVAISFAIFILVK